MKRIISYLLTFLIATNSGSALARCQCVKGIKPYMLRAVFAAKKMPAPSSQPIQMAEIPSTATQPSSPQISPQNKSLIDLLVPDLLIAGEPVPNELLHEAAVPQVAPPTVDTPNLGPVFPCETTAEQPALDLLIALTPTENGTALPEPVVHQVPGSEVVVPQPEITIIDEPVVNPEEENGEAEEVENTKLGLLWNAMRVCKEKIRALANYPAEVAITGAGAIGLVVLSYYLKKCFDEEKRRSWQVGELRRINETITGQVVNLDSENWALKAQLKRLGEKPGPAESIPAIPVASLEGDLENDQIYGALIEELNNENGVQKNTIEKLQGDNKSLQESNKTLHAQNQQLETRIVQKEANQAEDRRDASIDQLVMKVQLAQLERKYNTLVTAGSFLETKAKENNKDLRSLINALLSRPEGEGNQLDAANNDKQFLKEIIEALLARHRGQQGHDSNAQALIEVLNEEIDGLKAQIAELSQRLATEGGDSEVEKILLVPVATPEPNGDTDGLRNQIAQLEEEKRALEVKLASDLSVANNLASEGQARNEKLLQELEKLVEERASFEAKLQSAETSNGSQKNDNEILQGHVATLQQQNQEIGVLLQTADEELKAHAVQVGELNANNVRLEKKAEELVTALNQQKAEVELLKAQTIQSGDLEKGLTAKLGEVNGALEDKTKKIEDLEKRIAELTNVGANNEQLTQQIALLNQEKETLNEQYAALQNTLEQQEALLTGALDRQEAAHDRVVTQLKSDKAVIQKQLEAMKQELQDSNNALAVQKGRFEVELQQVANFSGAKEAQLKEMTKMLSEKQLALTELTNAAGVSTEQLATLQKEIAELTSQKTEVANQNEILKAQQTQIGNINHALTVKLETVHGTLQERAEEVAGLKKQLEELGGVNANNASLEEQIARLEVRITELDTQSEEKTKQLAEQDAALVAQQKKAGDIESTNQELAKSLEEGRGTLVERATRIERLEKRIAELASVGANNEQLAEQIAKLKEEIVELNAGNAEKTTQLTEQHAEHQKSLEQQKAAYEAMVASLKNDNVLTREQLEAKTQELAVQVREIQQLKDQSQGLEKILKENGETNAALLKANEENSGLLTQLQQVRDSAQRANKKNEELLARVGMLTGQKEKFEAELNTVKASNGELVGNNINLTAQLEEINNALQEKTTQLGAASEQLNLLQAQNASFETAVQKAEKENAELNAAISTVQGDIQRLNTAGEGNQALVNELRTQLKSASEELQLKTAQLLSANNQLSASTSVDTENQGLKNQTQLLEGQVSTLQSEVEGLQNKKLELENGLSQAKGALATATKNTNNLVNELETREKEKQDLEAELQKVAQVTKKLSEALGRLQKENEELKGQSAQQEDGARDLIGQLKQQKGDHEKVVAGLRTQMQELHDQLEAAKNNLDAQAAQTEKLKSEKNKAKVDAATAVRALGDKEETIKKLESDYGTANSDIEKKRNEIDRLTQMVNGLEGKLQEELKKNKELNDQFETIGSAIDKASRIIDINQILAKENNELHETVARLESVIQLLKEELLRFVEQAPAMPENNQVNGSTPGSPTPDSNNVLRVAHEEGETNGHISPPAEPTEQVSVEPEINNRKSIRLSKFALPAPQDVQDDVQQFLNAAAPDIDTMNKLIEEIDISLVNQKDYSLDDVVAIQKAAEAMVGELKRAISTRLSKSNIGRTGKKYIQEQLIADQRKSAHNIITTEMNRKEDIKKAIEEGRALEPEKTLQGHFNDISIRFSLAIEGWHNTERSRAGNSTARDALTKKLKAVKFKDE